jgi:hypothetical protein
LEEVLLWLPGTSGGRAVRRSENLVLNKEENKIQPSFVEIMFQSVFTQECGKTRVSMAKTRKAIERVGQRQVFVLGLQRLKRSEEEQVSENSNLW